MRNTALALVIVLSGVVELWARAATDEPGLLVRLYDVAEEMQALPELLPGQLPNVVKVVPTLDLRVERNDFEPLKELFLTEVVGQIEISKPAGVTLRLISDDGARLWIDGRVLIDHDGTHGPTPKDGRVELAAGQHALRIMHFQGRGGGQLSLLWEPTGTTLDGIVPVPAEAFSHRADTPRDTAPGRKRIIPALRRGRPGDGRPLDRPHPSALSGKLEWPDNTAVSIMLTNGELPTLSARGAVSPKSLIAWLPDDEGQTQYESAFLIHPREIKGEVIFSSDCGRWTGDPNREPFLDHVIVRAASGESKRFVHHGVPVRRPGRALLTLGSQGCVFRFGTPSDGRRASGHDVFEMLDVWPRTNGLEIDFTRPLDPRVGRDPESYYIEQWSFDVEKGLSPRRDGIVYPVKSASVRDDRRGIFLEIEDLKPSHVVYIRLLPPCISEDGELPWSAEAWYTLNVLPQDARGEVRTPPPAEPQNVLTDEEKAAGWRLVFDGQTTAGWRGYKKDAFPDEGWKVINGSLVRVGRGGDICTVDEFDNFELMLEWRISAAGNSGIFYRVDEQYGWPWESGPEMQVLDNAEHADGQNATTSAGSCYGVFAPARDVTQPVGLFNQARIVARGPYIEHWLNGEKVVEYELENPVWEKLIAESKFKQMLHHGRAKRGHIVLQDHGDRVWYRNIKVRTLGGVTNSE